MSRKVKKFILHGSRELYNSLLQQKNMVLQKNFISSVNMVGDIGYYNNIVFDNADNLILQTLIPDIVSKKKVLVCRYLIGKVSTVEVNIYNDKFVYRFIIGNQDYKITAM